MYPQQYTPALTVAFVISAKHPDKFIFISIVCGHLAFETGHYILFRAFCSSRFCSSLRSCLWIFGNQQVYVTSIIEKWYFPVTVVYSVINSNYSGMKSITVQSILFSIINESHGFRLYLSMHCLYLLLRVSSRSFKQWIVWKNRATYGE